MAGGASMPLFGEAMADFVGESLLFFIRALAICKISARRELRSPAVPDPSDHKDDPETLDPEISDPSSHVPVLGSSTPIGVVAIASDVNSGGSPGCWLLVL
jgi:hypothetical protein